MSRSLRNVSRNELLSRELVCKYTFRTYAQFLGMNGSKAWISNCFHPFISSHPWHHHHLLPSENHHPFHNIKVCNFTQAEHLCKISSALYLAHPNQNFRKRMSKFSFLDSILLELLSQHQQKKSQKGSFLGKITR